MSYQVACGCGKMYPVTGGDAGASFPCPCGRTVEVPPLHLLRADAGQASFSPDLQIPLMLQAGDLPGTDDCACCHRTTQDAVLVDIDCEQAEVKSSGGVGQKEVGCFLVGLMFGLLVFRRGPREQRILGRDVAFTVPLRVCAACAPDLRSATALRAALRREPVYAALLDKYPSARVARRA